ncbi:MAG: hypothetical protein EXS36_12270 [Pedosphaera sp.]|nr:hypothetical protein [Pedosphaera sp.]
MNQPKHPFLVRCRWVRSTVGSALIVLSLILPATAASVLPPSSPVVALTNGALQWHLPESPDRGWIIQQSTDLAHWESLGDPMNVVPQPGPVLNLPFVQAQPQSFFRAVSADRLARRELLQEQWSRWKATGLRTYEFEFRWNCFCAPTFSQWVRIAVADGAIVSVRRVEDGHELSPDMAGYRTLDGVFAWIAEAFAQNAARIDVTYDAGRGYPLSGFVDYHEQLADEERGFEVRFPAPPAALLLTEVSSPWSGDPYVVEAVRREGDWLQFEVAYSGGCVDPHGWELTAVPSPPAPGTPREFVLYLTHDARGDTCEAYLRRRLTFGLSSLRAGWATQSLAVGSEPVRLRLVVRDPKSNSPKARAILDYEWDPATFVCWRDVLTATAQQWHGGVFGSGTGTDYQLVLRFPPEWGDAVQVKTLWIDNRAFTPEVKWSALPLGAGRLATLSAAFHAIPRLDPDNFGQVLGVDEWPARDPKAPDYAAAALLVTQALGQTQEWPIHILHEFPPIFYP